MLDNFKDDVATGAKVAVAWLLTAWGHVTTVSSADMASWLAIVYTSVSLFVLVRDKIIKRRTRRKLEEPSDYTTL